MVSVNDYLEFEVHGKYALFSDPITRVGGEKNSYPLPTYDALRGICESIYWKPTFTWVVDKVRVLSQIRTEAKGIRTLSYTSGKCGRTCYTYLKDVRYQVRAHIEWNTSRPDLEHDRDMDKHFHVAERMIEKGGRRDIFFGCRECQAYVSPVIFGEVEGYYDKSGVLPFGFMYHSILYPDKTPEHDMVVNFYNVKMSNGVISFPRPENCPYKKVIPYNECPDKKEKIFKETKN